MGWNLEVACIRSPRLKVVGAVPDVFGATGKKVGFEDATSVMRDPDMCAAKVKDWILVIDVACRLSGFRPYLEETSAKGDMHVFRIADAPLELHYRRGDKEAEHRGLDACLRQKARADRDGEMLAMDLMKERTGISFTDDLWTVEFEVFALD